MGNIKEIGTALLLVIPLLASITLVLPMPTQTPDGNSIYLKFLGNIEGKGYFAELSPRRTWPQANKYCTQSGMHLASVDSAAQLTFLYDAYKSMTLELGSYWTGARDAQAASQFVWDFSGNMLDPNITPFGPNVRASLRTCVNWYAAPIGDRDPGEFSGDPCGMELGVMCEIYTK